MLSFLLSFINYGVARTLTFIGMFVSLSFNHSLIFTLMETKQKLVSYRFRVSQNDMPGTAVYLQEPDWRAISVTSTIDKDGYVIATVLFEYVGE